MKDPTATPSKSSKSKSSRNKNTAVKEEKDAKPTSTKEEEHESQAKDLLPSGLQDITILFIHQAEDDDGIKKTQYLSPDIARDLLESDSGVQLKFDLGSQKAEDGDWFGTVKAEILRLERCDRKGTLVIYLEPAVAGKVSTTTSGKSKAAIQKRESEERVLLVAKRAADNSFFEKGELGSYPPLRDVVFIHRGELFVVLTNMCGEVSTSDDDRQMQEERARIPLIAMLKARESQLQYKAAIEAAATSEVNGTADIAKADGPGSSTDIAKKADGAGSSTD